MNDVITQNLATLAVHAGGGADPATGAIAPSIQPSTTFRHGPAAERAGGFEYQREDHPNQQRLETALAALEDGAAALAFASGMAAATTLLETVPAGSHVLIPLDVYRGLGAFAGEFLPARGVAVDAVDATDPQAVHAGLRESTRLVWIETPSNPQLQVTDIGAVAAFTRPHGITLVCDNTFATPLLQRPLALGADVAMHSLTKYVGGHSDVLGGALVFARRDRLFDAVAHRRHLTGATLAPFSAWLLLRGLRSLPARLAWHCASARAVARFLTAHPAVAAVHYPGLAQHPQHALAARQMRDFGGMLSFRVHGGKAAALAVAGALELIVNATSLGGCETLIEHRASVEGVNPTSPEDLLRLSVGLEHADDLIADLRQALDRV